MFISGFQFAVGAVIGMIALVLAFSVFFVVIVAASNAVQYLKRRTTSNNGLIIGSR